MATASSVGLLPASLQASLQKLVRRINNAGAGVTHVLLSTSDGVPLGRVIATSASGDGEDGGPQVISTSAHSAWLAEEVLSSLESQPVLSQHYSLLQMGKEEMVTVCYDQLTLIHVFLLAPVVVTILATPSSNLGAIQSIGIPQLQEILEPLCQQLKSLFRDSSGVVGHA